MHFSHKKPLNVFIAAICLLIGACSAAQDAPEERVKSALDGLCDKFQQCTIETMKLQAGDEDMPAAVMNMFIEQSRAQCGMLMQQDDLDVSDEVMVEKSLACVNDMAESPCEELMMGKQPESCAEYEEYQNQR